MTHNGVDAPPRRLRLLRSEKSYILDDLTHGHVEVMGNSAFRRSHEFWVDEQVLWWLAGSRDGGLDEVQEQGSQAFEQRQWQSKERGTRYKQRGDMKGASLIHWTSPWPLFNVS
jgi:hypothetical protein